MTEQNIALAKAYYQAISDKNIAQAEKYLDEHVQFIGPLGGATGKEATVNAVKRFMGVFNTLTVRAVCGAEDQAMLAYDVDCPAPFGVIRGAVLLTFKNDLIVRYELFFDARPFEKKS
jgi:hypothetical protein